MQKQTTRNILYVAGLEALERLAETLGWNESQLNAAIAELIRQLRPTLAEI